MDTDDIAPPPATAKPVNLEGLSIQELHALIAGLEQQILAARKMIEAKQAHRGSADSLFKR
jgi:uncharacterized small protein (DUF1192 family)